MKLGISVVLSRSRLATQCLLTGRLVCGNVLEFLRSDTHPLIVIRF